MTNRTTPYGSRYTGWFYDAVTPTMKLYNRGTLVHTVATAGIVFEGTLAPASLTSVVGDTSAYVETAISGTLDALSTIGLVTDSTTT